MEIINSSSTANVVTYRVILNPVATRQLEREVYRALPVSQKTYSLDDVVTRMVDTGAPVKNATCRSVITHFANTVATILQEGNNVNISGFLRLALIFRGNLDSPEDVYDTDKHNVEVGVTVGKNLKTAAASISIRKQGTAVPPELKQVLDVASQKPNVITSQGTLFLTGENLHWDATNSEEGFFLNYGGEEERLTPVEDDSTPDCVVLKTTLIFDEAGLPLELFFRTRANGNLTQYKYPHDLVTAVKS